MSTDLYGVRILGIEPEKRKVTLRVFVVYYDTGYKSHQPLPTDHSFFLRILWDQGDTRFGGGGPIGDEIDVDHFLDEQWIDANTYRFVKSVNQVSTKNFPLADNDYEDYHDFYYERDNKWENEEKLVQADYEIIVTDEKYIQHLSTGLSWGTTAYETNALLIDIDHIMVIPDLDKTIQVLAPFEGETEDGTPDTFAFSSDGQYLFMTSQMNEIVAFSTNTWDELWRHQNEGMFGRLHLTESPELVSLQNEHTLIGGWHALTGEIEKNITAIPARLRSFQGKHLVEYGDDERLAFVSESGETIWDIPQQDIIEAVAFTPDNLKVALGGMYDHIEIWNTENREVTQRIYVGEERVNSLSFHPSGDYLAVLSFHGINIYHIDSGELIFKYRDSQNYYWEKANWTPDGKYFAASIITGTMGYGGHIKIVETGIST